MGVIMTINLTAKSMKEVLQWVLLFAILGLLLWSQPWNNADGPGSRKITVNGEATIQAEPDEYLFSPYFQKTGTDKEALKNQLTDQTNEAIAKLKELGVEERDLKLDASSYEYWFYVEGEESPMIFSLQISVDNKDLAQKVQDYLLTLDIQGQLTPTATFSEEKQKELDKQAIEKASEDAKSKAETQAKLAGAKIGKVLEINQASDSVFPIAYDNALSVGAAESSERSSLPILKGENEYSQTVTITYELQ